jgi:glycosyltransferase involved in cell wall biosynthesis
VTSDVRQTDPERSRDDVMARRREPLVSVLTPVFNGATHLRECIESVLAQTYTHWDYVIVDNCSTDHTLDIAQEYAARDSRIRVRRNQRFVPVIENHNIAFRQIAPASRYCKVVAADDWLFPECLEKMVALGEQHPNVAIVGSYRLEGDHVGGDCLRYPSTVVPGGREACRLRLLGGDYVFGSPTSVLYRSDIVRSRDAFYNETNLHADAEVCFEFLGDRDFGFVHQVLTFTRVREASLTSSSRSFNTYLPETIYELVKYGRKFLSPAELDGSIALRLDHYYRYLGRQMFKRRGREFWEFHRRELARLGHPLSAWRLGAAATSYFLDIALNPKATLEELARRLLSSRSSK